MIGAAGRVEAELEVEGEAGFRIVQGEAADLADAAETVAEGVLVDVTLLGRRTTCP